MSVGLNIVARSPRARQLLLYIRTVGIGLYVSTLRESDYNFVLFLFVGKKKQFPKR